MVEAWIFSLSISTIVTVITQANLEPSLVLGFRLHIYFACLMRLLTPIQCSSNQMSQQLIFTTNTCKRTSEFAYNQVAELDSSPGSISSKHLTGKVSLQLYYSPTHRKISSTKDNNGSNNKLSVFFQRPQYRPGLGGSQDCKLLQLSTAFPHHSHRLPGPFWGQKLKSLLLVGKIQKVAKANSKSVLIVLSSSLLAYRGVSTTKSYSWMTESAKKAED